MNYFYCPDCGFQHTEPASKGYFGEPISRTVMTSILDVPIDYLMNCPSCNGANCGVARMDHSNEYVAEKVRVRSAIAYHATDARALRNVSEK